MTGERSIFSSDPEKPAPPRVGQQFSEPDPSETLTIIDINVGALRNAIRNFADSSKVRFEITRAGRLTIKQG